MRTRSITRVALVVVLVLGTSGCFAIADLDRFEAGSGAGGRRTLIMHLCGFRTHLTHEVQVNVLTGTVAEPAPELLGRAIFFPFGGAPEGNGSFIMPGVLPPGDAHVTFFADFDMSGGLDPPPPDGLDHQWRFDIPATGTFEYPHEALFTPIAAPAPREPGGNFTLRVTDAMPAPPPQFLEVHVTRFVGTEAVINEGIARLAITGPSFDVVIPGIIRSGEDYRVEYYVDQNNDRRFGRLTEPSWRQDVTSAADRSLIVAAPLTMMNRFELDLAAPPPGCR